MNNVNIVQIMTIEDCNRYCWFCPNSTREMSGELMTNDVWLCIMDDLYDYDYRHDIHLHLQNEPLLDPHLLQRVKDARSYFPKNKIRFITNGDMLTKELVEEYAEAGISEIIVSDYDEQIDFEHPKMRVRGMEKIFRTFFNRGGNMLGLGLDPTFLECDMLKEKIAINYKGDVILCCSDYKYEVVFGNVKDRSLMDIYSSPTARHYLEANRKRTLETMPLCENCNRYVKGGDEPYTP